MIDSDLERRFERLAASLADRPVDTAGSWRRFAQLRAHAGRVRRRAVAVAVAGVTLAAVAIPAVAYQSHSGGPVRRHISQSLSGTSLTITARIRVPRTRGSVGDEGMVARMVDVAGQVWATSYADRLLKINTKTNRVVLDEYVPGLTDMTTGGGAIWLLKSAGRSATNLVKLDPASGRVLATLPLRHACGQMSYSGTQLWVACIGAGPGLVRVDPATGRVLATSGPMHGVTDLVATDDGVWYSGNSGVSGFVGTGARLRWVNAADSADLSSTNSLVYAQGAVWAFDSGETVVKIDPRTGRIERVYNSARYDPTNSLALDFFTVGPGSLWFLNDDGYQATSVLRVSLASGRPQGQVSKVGSCGEPCWQIYVAGGSVWVPTQTRIARIGFVSLRRPRRTASR